MVQSKLFVSQEIHRFSNVLLLQVMYLPHYVGLWSIPLGCFPPSGHS